jgi:hypothetical protein
MILYNIGQIQQYIPLFGPSSQPHQPSHRRSTTASIACSAQLFKLARHEALRFSHLRPGGGPGGGAPGLRVLGGSRRAQGGVLRQEV